MGPIVPTPLDVPCLLACSSLYLREHVCTLETASQGTFWVTPQGMHSYSLLSLLPPSSLCVLETSGLLDLGRLLASVSISASDHNIPKEAICPKLPHHHGHRRVKMTVPTVPGAASWPWPNIRVPRCMFT